MQKAAQFCSYLIRFSTASTCLSLTLAMQNLNGAKTVKIHGYVTEILSYQIFEVEDYRIVRAEDLPIQLSEEGSDSLTVFPPEELRVGLEVAVRGAFTETENEIRATSIRVFQEELRAVRRKALLERAPYLEMTRDGWKGDFFADGQVIRVNPFTIVEYQPNRSERKAQKRQSINNTEKVSVTATDGEDTPFLPLLSLDEIGPNTFLNYEGMRERDGSIAATRLTFMRNELQPNEEQFHKRMRPIVKQPNFEKKKPGRLRIGMHSFKLVPSREAQSYLRQLGESLIPEYQKNLPREDPNKIHFKFYLVKGMIPNAFATPNGVIVVFATLVEILENEAQLAFVLSHEISHTIQEHARQQMEHKRGERILLKLGSIAASAFGVPIAPDVLTKTEQAIVAGYSRQHENQADRIGIEYLVSHGYDPREAPRVWEIMAKSTLQTPAFFWASHDNKTKRRSYLMAELRNNYPKLDYSSYARNEEAYREFVRHVRAARKKKSR